MTTLSREAFIAVVAKTPLVSIDLLLQRPDGAVLLGFRCNRPAEGFWFVPGGRVGKDERLGDALGRIVRRELGDQVPLAGWVPSGVYEHFHEDNFAGEPGVSTHYVVLAHRLCLVGADPVMTPDDQHEALRWFPVAKLLGRDDVHPYTKAYFRGAGGV